MDKNEGKYVKRENMLQWVYSKQKPMQKNFDSEKAVRGSVALRQT